MSASETITASDILRTLFILVFLLRVLAKEVVQSRKAVNRLYTAKANLSSVQMQMQQQASTLR